VGKTSDAVREEAGEVKEASMKAMFVLYTIFIVSGIAYAAVIGLTHH
jgi:hypothetical protein